MPRVRKYISTNNEEDTMEIEDRIKAELTESLKDILRKEIRKLEMNMDSHWDAEEELKHLKFRLSILEGNCDWI